MSGYEASIWAPSACTAATNTPLSRYRPASHERSSKRSISTIAVLHDEDEGIAEALRRDAEFEANPSLGMSLEEPDQRIESRRS